MAKKTNTKLGRPTKYSPELGNQICDAIIATSKGIKTLCKENHEWPNPDTIFRWLKHNPNFSDQYAHAKRLQVEVLVDEIIEICDTKYENMIECNSARLKVDTRKWIACKLAPRIYGDKLDNSITFHVSHEEALKKLE